MTVAEPDAISVYIEVESDIDVSPRTFASFDIHKEEISRYGGKKDTLCRHKKKKKKKKKRRREAAWCRIIISSCNGRGSWLKAKTPLERGETRWYYKH